MYTYFIIGGIISLLANGMHYYNMFTEGEDEIREPFVDFASMCANIAGWAVVWPLAVALIVYGFCKAFTSDDEGNPA